jgi:hypothetical protein
VVSDGGTFEIFGEQKEGSLENDEGSDEPDEVEKTEDVLLVLTLAVDSLDEDKIIVLFVMVYFGHYYQ